MPPRPLQPFDAGLLTSNFILSLETAALLATETEPGAVEDSDVLNADAAECLRALRLDVIAARWVGLAVCKSQRTEAHQGRAHPGASATLLPLCGHARVLFGGVTPKVKAASCPQGPALTAGACPREALRSVLAVALAVRRKGGGELGLGVLDLRILPTMLWVKDAWLGHERGLTEIIWGCCGCCNCGCAFCCRMAARPAVRTEQLAGVLHVVRVRGVSVRSCEREEGRDNAHAS
mmetsp:Transcript_91160/g.181254  ORF Transcript_91160/g.181254 Transcript_91160/m.181254 type:complete len:235 (+) Transcript_91160:1594-2298(+)